MTAGQIFVERKAWARGKFTVAWLKLCKAVEDPMLSLAWLEVLEKDLAEAQAIADEWGIDPRAVAEELASEVQTGTKAR